jgi:hypothetical protein
VTLIWSTRGRHWGHRFLRSGGSSDPLVDRDRAFVGADEYSEVCNRRGGTLALRFEDPEGRTDAAGRIIVHELIVSDPNTGSVNSVEDGIAAYWPHLAEEYSQVWDSKEPPKIKP